MLYLSHVFVLAFGNRHTRLPVKKILHLFERAESSPLGLQQIHFTAYRRIFKKVGNCFSFKKGIDFCGHI